jgi:hypothetical protein
MSRTIVEVSHVAAGEHMVPGLFHIVFNTYTVYLNVKKTYSNLAIWTERVSSTVIIKSSRFMKLYHCNSCRCLIIWYDSPYVHGQLNRQLNRCPSLVARPWLRGYKVDTFAFIALFGKFCPSKPRQTFLILRKHYRRSQVGLLLICWGAIVWPLNGSLWSSNTIQTAIFGCVPLVDDACNGKLTMCSSITDILVQRICTAKRPSHHDDNNERARLVQWTTGVR